MRTYDEHLDAWEAHRPARLRRRRLQRAPHLALRADELAQPDGGGRGAAHQAAQAADLRQPAAAARAAAAGRGAGDDRLPVERAARSPASRAASRASTRCTTCRWRSRARASRRPTRSSPAPGPRRCSRFEGRFWSYKDVAIWPRPVQQPHPPIWVPGHGSKEIDRVRRPRTISRSRRALRRARPARRHHPLLRQVPGAQPATASRREHLIIAGSAYVADSKAQAVKEAGPLHPLFQPHAVQPRQRHRDRARSARPVTSATPRSTTCGPRTCARPRDCARISAT